MEEILKLYMLASYPIVFGYIVTLLVNVKLECGKCARFIKCVLAILVAPLFLLFILGGLLCKKAKE